MDRDEALSYVKRIDGRGIRTTEQDIEAMRVLAADVVYLASALTTRDDQYVKKCQVVWKAERIIERIRALPKSWIDTHAWIGISVAQCAADVEAALESEKL